MSRRILLLFCHPAFQVSRANRALLQAATGLDGVTVHDLYEEYPDLLVDEKREQELLLAHDVIVAQFPFYWYSTPALFKQWQDLVLTYGFAYGPHGTALAGKTMMCTVTIGGSRKAYTPEGYNRFSPDELLRPLEATAALCGCQWEAPFVLFSSRACSDEALVAKAEHYRHRLIGLRDGAAAVAAIDADLREAGRHE